ncbi:Uma2 family endonuclease [Cohnella panacarvi]|uniref:Uma2 family endonuclease n=1 Tax=Cohnella panacarvi TaxID=400776 RepID=UPI00047C2AB3|nr:Uma2 family endonuclease [Cohnella panacarvi]
MTDQRKPKEDRVKEQPVTYDVYASMPDDGMRYEVFDGVLEAMSPSPTATHQTVSRELLLVMQSCKSEYLIFYAPLDVILSHRNVLQPDLLLVHRNRANIVTERGVEGAPDLIVEILSPSSRARDKVVKMRIYAKHGVPEYWVVETKARTIERYVLTEAGVYELRDLFEENDAVSSDKLPCAAFVVGELFSDLPHA